MAKLYTKTGDQGKTQLVTGKKVAKYHPRIEAYGSIDELNSHIGLLCSWIETNKSKLNNFNELETLYNVQNELFNIGSHLACDDPEVSKTLPKINPELILSLEQKMDEQAASLPPLKTFILPGGSELASQSHICRCVCRRAERKILELRLQNEEVDENIIRFVNRLSDYFFSIARLLNNMQQIEDVTWRQQ